MRDFKARLEKYIEAEVQRRVEERLAKVLDELGPGSARPRRRRSSQPTAAGTERLVAKPRRPVSAETRAKMRAAWARRKAAGDRSGPARGQ
jgi:hypothetical protein